MAIINKYPYTDFQQVNLDWILEELADLVNSWNDFGGTVTADAYQSLTPEVNVTGDLKTNLNFSFGLVKGNEGPTGPEGPEGPAGHGLEILDVYPTLADLQTAHPTGNVGDAYLVGTGGSYEMYVWSEDQNAWADAGSITSPSPSNTNPVMDGTASPGSSLEYSRGDHKHPSDTAKQDKLVSGVSIKTVNNYSLLGSGDVSVQAPLVSGTNIKTVNSNSLLGSGDVTVQETLVSGTNIKTINSNDILGSGDLTVQETLVSGTNIKTINNNDILGSGDLTINAVLNRQVLWTNSDDTQSFAAQTLDISTAGYSLLVIDFKVNTSSSNEYITVTMPFSGRQTVAIGVLPTSNTIYKRKLRQTAGTVQFYGGYAGTTADNTAMIPRAIYAY